MVRTSETLLIQYEAFYLAQDGEAFILCHADDFPFKMKIDGKVFVRYFLREVYNGIRRSNWYCPSDW